MEVYWAEPAEPRVEILPFRAFVDQFLDSGERRSSIGNARQSAFALLALSVQEPLA